MNGRVEVAQVMLRLTMTAEEQRVGKQWDRVGWDGSTEHSEDFFTRFVQLHLNNSGFNDWNQVIE